MPQFDPTKYGAVRAEATPAFDPAAYGAKPAAPSPAAKPAAPVHPTQTLAYQSILGATPEDVLARLKGAGRKLAKGAMSAVQYLQYLNRQRIPGGGQVSPTPPWMEPTGDPNEAVGGQVAELTAGLALPAGGSRMTTQAALGSFTGAAMGAQDSPEAAATGAVLGGVLPAAAHGVVAGVRKVAEGPLPGIVKAASQEIQKGSVTPKSIIKAVADRPREPIQALTQALKPISTNIQFAANAEKAMPHIKAAEAQLGHAIETVQDFRDATTVAKRQLWSEYESILGPQAARGVDGSPVADAIENSISLKLRIQDPAAVKRIQALANTYRRVFKLGELDDMLTTSNAELESYYGKYPAARNTAARGNPEIAQNVAEAESLRELIYGQLDKSGTARQLKQTYGALINMEKEAQRRLNVAARQNPQSLSEQLSRWQAVMEVGKAAGDVLSLSPFKAAGRLSAAYFGRQSASAIREANSADALIANAFRNYTGTPTPMRAVFPQVKGLLESGPMVTPPPADASFVRGVPAQPAVSGTPRLLTEGTPPARPMSAAPDTSYVRGVEARPAMSRFTLSKVGSGITQVHTEQTLAETTKLRMREFSDMVRSGATEMTGKAIRESGSGKIVGRHGGGIRIVFPEFKDFPESPSQIAEAIERGEGKLFNRVQKAVRDALPERLRQPSDIDFGFGANAPPRAAAIETLRSRLRKNP